VMEFLLALSAVCFLKYLQSICDVPQKIPFKFFFHLFIHELILSVLVGCFVSCSLTVSSSFLILRRKPFRC